MINRDRRDGHGLHHGPSHDARLAIHDGPSPDDLPHPIHSSLRMGNTQRALGDNTLQGLRNTPQVAPSSRLAVHSMGCR